MIGSPSANRKCKRVAYAYPTRCSLRRGRAGLFLMCSALVWLEVFCFPFSATFLSAGSASVALGSGFTLLCIDLTPQMQVAAPACLVTSIGAVPFVFWRFVQVNKKEHKGLKAQKAQKAVRG